MQVWMLLADATPPGPKSPIVTAAYVGLALLCLRRLAGARSRGAEGRLASRGWLALAAMFAVLAAARSAGLQSRVTAIFRRWAVTEGWYLDRRRFQAWVVAAAVVGSMAAMVAVGAFALRRRSSRGLIAFAPIAVLLGFLAVRLVSLHQVDHLIYRRVAGVEINAAVELALLGMIGIGLLRRGADPVSDPDRLSSPTRRSSERRGRP